MFGKKESYNNVPLPEYYTEADWERDHRDLIEENLVRAEAQVEVRDDLAHDETAEPAENNIDEVD